MPERIKLTSIEWDGPWGHPVATIDEAGLLETMADACDAIHIRRTR